MLIFKFVGIKHGKIKFLLSDHFSEILNKTNTVGIFKGPEHYS